MEVLMQCPDSVGLRSLPMILRKTSVACRLVSVLHSGG